MTSMRSIEAVAERVHVRDLAVGEQGPVEGVHALVHHYADALLAGVGEAPRLDARVDLRELPAPVVAHRFAARDAPALEGVRPVDVGVQGPQHGLDVARVERRVHLAQQRLPVAIAVHGAMMPDTQLLGCV